MSSHTDKLRAAAEEVEKKTAEQDRETDLRASLNRTLRLLEKAKASKAELVDAVYNAALDGIRGMSLKPIGAPKLKQSKGTAETGIAVLSDWQLAKTTPTYSSEVCAERMEKYGDRAQRLADLQRTDHPVRELHVNLLGDIVEGEMIFPGQAHRIDASLFRQVLIDGPQILGNFLRRMCGTFERVHVTGVIGNHGAIGGLSRRDHHPETNADSMLYEVTRQVLEASGQERLTWAPTYRPKERHWYAVDTIGEKKYFMFHGDQISGGFAGYPWYGFGRKLLRWSNNKQIPKFDYAFSGHFHTPVRLYENGLTLWGNGSTESDNTYAAEMLAASGEPCQWLLFAHPKHGVTAEYLVKLG